MILGSPRINAHIDNIDVPGRESTFPLTPDEAHLIYSELVRHTFSRDHPMYHYAGALLSRIDSYLNENKDKLNLCKDVEIK